VESTYCNLSSGCEYYLFVQKFMSLDGLRLKDTLSSDDKVRAFIQDVLFSIHSGHRPKDAFGFDGMRRPALALVPPPPFIYLFLKGTGSPNPKLRMALTIRRRVVSAEPSVVTDQPFRSWPALSMIQRS
jgi:hypothetical protein